MNAPLPKPTPRFFAVINTEMAVAPLTPVVAAKGPNSLGFDAALPANPATAFRSQHESWETVRAQWLAHIESEQLIDLQLTHYRTPTTVAPQGLHLRETDGALMRRLDGEGLAYTPRAWSQLIGLLMQGHADRPRSCAEAYRWVGPEVRPVVFQHLRDRSRRQEGEGHELLLRTYVDQRRGARALRAVLSGRHSGIHFDDLSVCDALSSVVQSTAKAQCARDVDETHGYAVLRTEGDARATITWHNSETGAASLSFGAACYIAVLDTVIRGTETKSDVELPENRSVAVASATGGTRRAHTLPRANATEATRARVARERMTRDIRSATAQANALAASWAIALTSFPEAFNPTLVTGADRATAAAIILDIIEENSRVTAEDRKALEAVLIREDRLQKLPFGSRAHIAGAYAVLASQQTSWEESKRLQCIAGNWVTKGFNP
jgi:hypothetical protein